ncbi:hypothetical protein psyc5s11_16250 [Clostridium gelidum]|uniref:Transposase DDE domain-containing protein n=1 Tax=Clostridium gelidum TaxID=704125 RepID=A0ABM7T1P9_9CLOT|nr:hypothetical protein psyc5s11_16250 [Clostridium gelidum]
MEKATGKVSFKNIQNYLMNSLINKANMMNIIVFAVIKQYYRFRRFFMRGNIKVRTEFLLMAFGYNMNKLHSKTLQARNGKLLHKKQAY